MALALTTAGIALGYGLTTYMTGFPGDGTLGPLGLVFTATGELITAWDMTASRVLTGASQADGQAYASLTDVANPVYATSVVSGLCKLGNRYFLARRGAYNDVCELNANGTVKGVIVAGLAPFPVGLAADGVGGLLYCSVGNTIVRIDPVANTQTVWVTGLVGPDGVAVDAAGTTVYVVTGGTNVRGYRVSDGAKVFDYVGGGQTPLTSPDGIGVYGAVLIVNSNGGLLYQLPIVGGAATVIASGGDRGDFVSVHPNGSLVVTQKLSMSRLAIPVAAPAGLTATPACGQVALSWNAALGATGYNIYRSTTSGSGYTKIGTSLSTNYIDNTPSPVTTYYYVVTATNVALESGYSNEAVALIGPLAPTNLAGFPVCSGVNVSWDAMACATSYNVYRSTASGVNYQLIGSTAIRSFADAGLLPATTYYYSVTSVSAGHETGYSTEISVTAKSSPLAPTNLTAIPGDDLVLLSWTAPASDAIHPAAISYIIYRGTAHAGPQQTYPPVPGLYSPPGPGTLIDAQIGTSTTPFFTDTTAEDGVQYFYRVAAVNTCGTGTKSVEVAATPVCCLRKYVDDSPPVCTLQADTSPPNTIVAEGCP